MVLRSVNTSGADGGVYAPMRAQSYANTWTRLMPSSSTCSLSSFLIRLRSITPPDCSHMRTASSPPPQQTHLPNIPAFPKSFTASGLKRFPRKLQLGRAVTARALTGLYRFLRKIAGEWFGYFAVFQFSGGKRPHSDSNELRV